MAGNKQFAPGILKFATFLLRFATFLFPAFIIYPIFAEKGYENGNGGKILHHR